MQDVQLLIYEQHPSQAACILGFKGATVKVQTVNFNSPPGLNHMALTVNILKLGNLHQNNPDK